MDFNALATYFGKTGKFWSDGDFIYDGTVNTSDLTALAGNFNATPLSDLPVLGTFVPKPGMSASVVAVPMIGVFLRRRKSGSAIRN